MRLSAITSLDRDAESGSQRGCIRGAVWLLVDDEPDLAAAVTAEWLDYQIDVWSVVEVHPIHVYLRSSQGNFRCGMRSMCLSRYVRCGNVVNASPGKHEVKKMACPGGRTRSASGGRTTSGRPGRHRSRRHRPCRATRRP